MGIILSKNYSHYPQSSNIQFVGSSTSFNSQTTQKQELQKDNYHFECAYCGKKLNAKAIIFPKFSEQCQKELLNNAVQRSLQTLPFFHLNNYNASQENINRSVSFQDERKFEEALDELPFDKLKLGVNLE